jgi:hypothetical protein
MANPFHITAHVLTIIFMVGVAGCAIAIPIIAWKFASVLFEKDLDGDDASAKADTNGAASESNSNDQQKVDERAK